MLSTKTMPLVPQSITKLINELSRLPGIGEKTAARLTFYLLRSKETQRKSLGEAVSNLKLGLKYCKKCFNLAKEEVCGLCQNPLRNQKQIFVVSSPLDVISIEKTCEFKGVYHILHGEISPIEGISPDELTIENLLQRIIQNNIKEVILGTNPTTEGEATAMYIYNKINSILPQASMLKITRIGKGLPMGCLIEYADETTLKKSLEGRRVI